MRYDPTTAPPSAPHLQLSQHVGGLCGVECAAADEQHMVGGDLGVGGWGGVVMRVVVDISQPNVATGTDCLRALWLPSDLYLKRRLSLHTCRHTHAHARTRTQTHTHTHAHTRALPP